MGHRVATRLPCLSRDFQWQGVALGHADGMPSHSCHVYSLVAVSRFMRGVLPHPGKHGVYMPRYPIQISIAFICAIPSRKKNVSVCRVIPFMVQTKGSRPVPRHTLTPESPPVQSVLDQWPTRAAPVGFGGRAHGSYFKSFAYLITMTRGLSQHAPRLLLTRVVAPTGAL